MNASHSIVIGVVGKPSVGKSTFFNAVTEGKAKMGNFPFTTIEPNTGVTYYRAECPSVSRGKQDVCKPKYGYIKPDGTRFIPVRLLDVAGLVPGASEGAGLGNKFLNDLTGADVLVHIIDVSGTTNEKGEATTGYDPLNDADWLVSEIHAWIFNNLWSRWHTVARRHAATKQSVANTLILQLSGYGAKIDLVNRVLNDMNIRDPCDLAEWTEDQVHELVETFISYRFQMVLLLNKADQGGETDKHIQAVVEKYEPRGYPCIVGSAGAELFLKNVQKKKFIRYSEGADMFTTKADELEDLEFRVSRGESIPDLEALKAALDEEFETPGPKIAARLDKLKDMVMYRFGGTGVWQAVQTAVDLRKPAIAYPVRSITNFSTEVTGGGVFADCYLLKKDTTVRQLAAMVSSALAERFAYAEGEDGRRLAEDHIITGQQFIVKFTASAQEAPSASGGGSKSDPGNHQAHNKKDSSKAGAADEAATS